MQHRAVAKGGAENKQCAFSAVKGGEKKKMKSSKKKMFITTIILAFLISNAYVLLFPTVLAAESTTVEESLEILASVADLNMAAYTPKLTAHERNSYLTLPQEEADFSLTSSQGELRARFSFTNGHLRKIYVSDVNGALSLNQPAADTIGNAKGFLERYQNYTGVPLYGELKAMLDGVDADKNVTKTDGNVQLQVSVIGKALVDFKWTYVDENGVPAPAKNVILSYRDGALKCFLDNWQLYRVAGVALLSDDAALSEVMAALEDYTFDVVDTNEGNVTVSGFKVASVGNLSLCYLNYQDASAARGGDPFTLYPSWYVPLGFDKVYPGCVTGVYVRVWADTGEVSSISPMVYGMASSVEASGSGEVQEQAIVLSIPIAVAAGFCLIVFCFGTRRLRFVRFNSGSKRSLKLSTVLLCVLLSSGLLFAVIPKVQAVFPGSGASAIHASTYNQIPPEQAGAYTMSLTLEALFKNEYYKTARYYNTSVTGYNVLNTAYSMDRNYDRVAVFYFGHMAGNNVYWCPDDNVTAAEVAAVTTGTTFFAWSWVCNSASEWPETDGLPVAWTQVANMSNDSYVDPDDGGHCYFGFDGASPLINNNTGYCFKGTYASGMDFICSFYAYALTYDYSINDALNHASLDEFSDTYEDSPLYDGFETWWPGGYGISIGWYEGWMRTYGNGNLHLYNSAKMNVAAGFNFYVGWLEGDVEVLIDGQYAGYTCYSQHLKTALDEPGNHTVEVPSWNSGFPFLCFDGYPDGENPITVYVEEGTTEYVVAYYSHKKYLTISAGAGGNTTPSPGVHEYLEFSQVPVTANAGSGYDFDHWLLDGGSYTQNPINVNMDSNHTLQAVFVQEPFDLTVNVLNQYSETGYIPLYIDDQYVGTTGYTYPVTAGNHKIYVESPFFGGSAYHFFQHYYYDSTYNYDNPMTIPINQDKTVTAYYYSTYG